MKISLRLRRRSRRRRRGCGGSSGGGLSGSVVFVLLHGVGVELLQQTAQGALVGDAEAAPEGGIEATVAVRIVEVRDGAADQVAQKIRVRGLPFAVVAPGAG